jgi:hypothetical protein
MRCDACGAPFEPKRRDHRYCSPGCRHRGFARARADECREALAALERLRGQLEADLARWDAVAAGTRQRMRQTP